MKHLTIVSCCIPKNAGAVRLLYHVDRTGVQQRKDAIMYPPLRVEIPEVKEDLLRGVPPGITAPASVKAANVQRESHLSSFHTAEGHGLAKRTP
jgi:hypothetical protein